MTKNELAGRIMIKIGLPGPQWRVKGAIAAPKNAISVIFYSFYDDIGRMFETPVLNNPAKIILKMFNNLTLIPSVNGANH